MILKFVAFLFTSILFTYLIWVNHLVHLGVNPLPGNLAMLGELIGSVTPFTIGILYFLAPYLLFYRRLSPKKSLIHTIWKFWTATNLMNEIRTMVFQRDIRKYPPPFGIAVGDDYNGIMPISSISLA
ncbi:MAG: hypothetical protein AAF361_11265 [Bacteroidota bacterium]